MSETLCDALVQLTYVAAIVVVCGERCQITASLYNTGTIEQTNRPAPVPGRKK